jgi:hypothetical protein
MQVLASYLENLSDEEYMQALRQCLTDGVRRGIVQGVGLMWNSGSFFKPEAILYFSEDIELENGYLTLKKNPDRDEGGIPDEV